jgi:hypothetical protein
MQTESTLTARLPFRNAGALPAHLNLTAHRLDSAKHLVGVRLLAVASPLMLQ